MRTLIIIFCIVSVSSLFGQNVREYMKSGIKKQEMFNYRGAVEDYTKAIELDARNADAYLNRGNSHLGLKDLESAIRDLEKATELSPTLARAYYSLATIYAMKMNYTLALQNADKVVKLDSTIPNCLTLRGQLFMATGEKEKGCEDFIIAKSKGDTNALKYLQRSCGFIKGYGESLKINWPDEEKWKLASDQESGNVQVLDIIKEGESLDNWTELGNMMAYRGVEPIPMAKMMEILYGQAKKNAPESKLTFIEKDEKAEYPWAIFMIESPRFNNDDKPESQLWYVIQGRQALYSNFRAVKQAKITDEQREKWIKFFKASEIVYR